MRVDRKTLIMVLAGAAALLWGARRSSRMMTAGPSRDPRGIMYGALLDRLGYKVRGWGPGEIITPENWSVTDPDIKNVIIKFQTDYSVVEIVFGPGFSTIPIDGLVSNRTTDALHEAMMYEHQRNEPWRTIATKAAMASGS